MNFPGSRFRVKVRIMVIRRLLLLLIVLVALPQPAAARDDNPDLYLRRGVYVDGRVWLLTDDGGLFSIEERTRRRTEANLQDDVLDICRRDGHLLAVTGDRFGDGWAVRRRTAGGNWQLLGRAPRSNDTLLAMDCTAGAPLTLLTTGRLIEIGADGARIVRLPDLIYGQVNLTLLGTSEHLYVGINSGEWGGGLVRVDRTSGAISRIERTEADGDCHAGPLDTNCDPVHAIVPIPWRRDCLALAIGLVHFLSHGRIAEVCGERVEALYSRNDQTDINGDPDGEREVPTSEAFFGMVPAKGALLAAGTEGLYRIGPAGLIDTVPYPAFHSIRGVHLNFDQPDAILAVTQINRRASVSGSAPLLIPR